MKSRYAIRCYSRIDESEVRDVAGFPLFFMTKRGAERRFDEIQGQTLSNSLYRYEIVPMAPNVDVLSRVRSVLN